MNPKIIFRRSRLYDQALKRRRGFVMSSNRVLERHMRKIEKQWRKLEGKILREIAKITKLKWHEKEIVCYVTTGVIPYSDPLTLNLRSDIATLIHELIHRILSESENRLVIKKNWNRLQRKYKNESQKTKIHVLVHAIYAHILLKFFGKKSLQRKKRRIHDHIYIRAWEIVDREGHEDIIQQLTKKL